MRDAGLAEDVVNHVCGKLSKYLVDDATDSVIPVRKAYDDETFGEQNAGQTGGSPNQQSRVASTAYGGAQDSALPRRLPQVLWGGLADRRAEAAWKQKQITKTLHRGRPKLPLDAKSPAPSGFLARVRVLD
jgi:hypothetical protein